MSVAPIIIDVWSDLCCPFCYVGDRKLRAALKIAKVDAKVRWRAFELDKTAPPCEEESLVVTLAGKLGGVPIDTVESSMKILSQELKEWDIDYNWKQVKLGNTFNAHRIVKLAEEKGKGPECRDRLFKAYHTDGLALGEKPVLKRLALEVGLPEAEVDDVLNGLRYTSEVRADEDEASLNDILATPHYIFNGKLSVSGAKSVEEFVAILTAGGAGEVSPASDCSNQVCSVAKLD